MYISFPGCPVPPYLQILWYIATGNDQIGISDCCDVSPSYVSRCVAKVAYAIGSFSVEEIKFPDNNYLRRTQQEFMAIARMPGVIGCIDCTHVEVQMPTHPRPEIFRNRKKKIITCSGCVWSQSRIFQHCSPVAWQCT